MKVLKWVCDLGKYMEGGGGRLMSTFVLMLLRIMTILLCSISINFLKFLIAFFAHLYFTTPILRIINGFNLISKIYKELRW